VKIGVFDSGVGGQSVINAIKKQLPDLEIIYKDDKSNLPYGDKTAEEIHTLVKPIFQEFVDEDCKVIVIACNTVTTSLITELRKEFKVPIIGMEPAVKPAAEDKYAHGVVVVEPDCGDWALMIENDQIDRDKIAKTVEKVLKQGADQIVLGCTHYHWIEDEIKELAGNKAAVIQSEKSVIKQLKIALEQLA
jgi:glutamate racemase